MSEAQLAKEDRSRLTNDAPHFLVGRDRQAGWVVIETHGRCGGLFCDAEAALRFAKEASEGHVEAIEFAKGPLDFTLTRAA
jgi:hypothetical protein